MVYGITAQQVVEEGWIIITLLFFTPHRFIEVMSGYTYKTEKERETGRINAPNCRHSSRALLSLSLYKYLLCGLCRLWLQPRLVLLPSILLLRPGLHLQRMQPALLLHLLLHQIVHKPVPSRGTEALELCRRNLQAFVFLRKKFSHIILFNFFFIFGWFS